MKDSDLNSNPSKWGPTNDLTVAFVTISIIGILIGSMMPIGYIASGFMFSHHSVLVLIGFIPGLPFTFLLFIISGIIFIIMLLRAEKSKSKLRLKLVITLLSIHFALIFTSIILMVIEW